jgi:prepilin-type N-terminal cleavage/methylation domain-containing protein
MQNKIVFKDNGFTLVELLVVMAIMAVLIGISVAGLGYAMRRSRNISRSSSATNLDKALASHYADEQSYPAQDTIDNLASSALDEYLEGSWDPGPPMTVYCYKSGQNDTLYSVCVSQEQNDATHNYVCYGPGVGKDSSWPGNGELDTCTNCGSCKIFEENGNWGNHDGGDDNSGGGGAGGDDGDDIPEDSESEGNTEGDDIPIYNDDPFNPTETDGDGTPDWQDPDND